MRPGLSVPPPLPVSRIGSWLALWGSPSNRLEAQHQDRIVEQRRLALVDVLHPLRQIGELRDVELVGLQVHRFLFGGAAVVREVEVERALDAVEELEVHLRQIVVQHQRRDPRLVHLEREDDQVEHQLHVIRHVLRQLVGRARHVGLGQRRAPAFDPLFLRGALDALLDVADRLEVLAELAVVVAADLRRQALRVLAHGVEDAAIERPAACRRRPADRTSATG